MHADNFEVSKNIIQKPDIQNSKFSTITKCLQILKTPVADW
jgi:hypothetical protein